VNALSLPHPGKDSSEDLQKVQTFGFFGSTYNALKLALQTVKGLNCVFKWVAGIQDSAEAFNESILLCGATASQDVTNLIAANQAVIDSCGNILNLKSTVCAGTDDENAKVSNSCFVKTLSLMLTLKDQVEEVVELSKKLPQTGPNAVECVNEAVDTLTRYYTEFPQNIVECSKL
ncbi:hypothetical protein KR018_010181, partial [Drosophila ironensis]